jgi:hypothetical protein
MPKDIDLSNRGIAASSQISSGISAIALADLLMGGNLESHIAKNLRNAEPAADPSENNVPQKRTLPLRFRPEIHTLLRRGRPSRTKTKRPASRAKPSRCRIGINRAREPK